MADDPEERILRQLLRAIRDRDDLNTKVDMLRAKYLTCQTGRGGAPGALRGNLPIPYVVGADEGWERKMRCVAKRVLGLSKERDVKWTSGQLEVLRYALVDRIDVLAVMATGSGKGLLFELPAALACIGNTPGMRQLSVGAPPDPGGCVIVFVPFTSLATEHTRKAREFASRLLPSKPFVWSTLSSSGFDGSEGQPVMITAAGAPHQQREEHPSHADGVHLLDGVTSGAINLVFTTVEAFLIDSPRGRSLRAALAAIHQRGLWRLSVVDECHLFVENAFRAALGNIGYLMELIASTPDSTRSRPLPRPPVIALSASAPSDLVPSIMQESLRSTLFRTVRRPLFRPEIHLELIFHDVDARGRGATPSSAAEAGARHCWMVLATMGADREAATSSGIVFVHRQRDAVEVAKHLGNVGLGDAVAYHRGLSPDEKQAAMKLWREHKVYWMVGTSAVAHGIDNPDVDAVVHAQLPVCPTSYYQASGRGARGGVPKCVSTLVFSAALLPSIASVCTLESQLTGVVRMLNFVASSTCRWSDILLALGDVSSVMKDSAAAGGGCPGCGACDVCNPIVGTPIGSGSVDLTASASAFINDIISCDSSTKPCGTAWGELVAAIKSDQAFMGANPDVYAESFARMLLVELFRAKIVRPAASRTKFRAPNSDAWHENDFLSVSVDSANGTDPADVDAAEILGGVRDVVVPRSLPYC